jgi:hypothetical protein
VQWKARLNSSALVPPKLARQSRGRQAQPRPVNTSSLDLLDTQHALKALWGNRRHLTCRSPKKRLISYFVHRPWVRGADPVKRIAARCKSPALMMYPQRKERPPRKRVGRVAAASSVVPQRLPSSLKALSFGGTGKHHDAFTVVGGTTVKGNQVNPI